MDELKLTVKDKRIIGALFDNARMPFSQVGKQARLSKESVNYRVRRLMSEGLLVGFNTVIDVKRLGWEILFVYIRFRHVDADEEREILEHLKSHPHVAQLFRCMGNYDAIIKVFVPQYPDIDEIMKDIEARFREQIDEYRVDYLLQETAVPFSFLYEFEKGRKTHLLARQTSEPATLQATDLKVLQVLAKNARMSFAEIAEKLKISADLVKYHVKKLEGNGTILKYRPDLLPKRLGYNWYFLILKTGKLNPQLNSALTSFLLNHPHVTYFYRSAGSSDVQVELRAKTNEELSAIVLDIRGILKRVLKRSELLIILDEPKYTYFPDCMMETQPR